MHVFLPVASVSMHILVLLGLGWGVGFLSGMFGVGGGFILTPLLIMTGIPPVIAAASGANQIAGTSAAGVVAHARHGTVDFKMGWLLLAGGVIGSTLGVRLVKILRAAGKADFAISVIYILMLAITGTYMFIDSARTFHAAKKGRVHPVRNDTAWVRFISALPWQMHFERSGVTVSVLLPFLLSTAVGVLSATGIGGGFIMVPAMVYLLRMPMHVVVGTSLFQICFTCISVTVQQAWLNRAVDIVLAGILLASSVFGVHMGVRLGKKLHADHLKISMSIIILAVMLKMLWGLLVTPEVLAVIKG